MSKRILLCITGSVATYKTCELVRILRKQGHDVTVAMSRAATEFVSSQTFEVLSGNPVLTDQDRKGMAHINATRAADIMLIAPATANTIAKIAHGIADNLITNMVIARNCPLVLAPAMNVYMWRNPANIQNIKQLHQNGIRILVPAFGEQACGEIGTGRMLEPEEIADLLPDSWASKPLRGKKVLITAGATFESIDPVRGITNLSSGQMGMALVRACRRAGAKVSLIHGIINTPLPAGLRHKEEAISAQAMNDSVFRHINEGVDAFISVAAVADYYVQNAATQKLKKSPSGEPPIIQLAENPDILQSVAALPNPPFCVGFAAESENILENAREKRQKKGVPLLVANDVSLSLGKNNSATIMLIDNEQETTLLQVSKDQAAEAVVARMSTLLLKKMMKQVKPK